MKAKEITNLLAAGYSAFWISTDEPRRAKEVIMNQIASYQRKDGQQYQILDWSCVDVRDPKSMKSPLEPLTLLAQKELVVAFLANFHWFVDKPQIVQTIQDLVPEWSSKGSAVIVLSPFNKIPKELERDFTLLEFALPNEEEIKEIFQYSLPDEVKMPKGSNLEKLIDAAKGLSQIELDNACALSIVKTGNLDVEYLYNIKIQSIQKSGLIEVIRPKRTFNDVIGYDIFKEQVLSTVNNKKAKGVIVIGPPGSGKTSLMEAVAGETGIPCLKVYTGKLFSKYQGETEKNVDYVINLIISFGRCIVFFDEFEKQFSGVSGDGSLDSGVTIRQSSRWLDFMQNHPPGIYKVATCNSFKGIPGEYLRPGRWDTAPFYIGMPTQTTRIAIMKYYIDKFGLKSDQELPDMDDWTGCEIEACCQNAEMKSCSLVDAAKVIIPQARTKGEDIMALAAWAEGRTILAESKELFAPISNGKKKRKIDKK